MKKFTFGTPEKLVPSVFCDKFQYTETPGNFPAVILRMVKLRKRRHRESFLRRPVLPVSLFPMCPDTE